MSFKFTHAHEQFFHVTCPRERQAFWTAYKHVLGTSSDVRFRTREEALTAAVAIAHKMKDAYTSDDPEKFKWVFDVRTFAEGPGYTYVDFIATVHARRPRTEVKEVVVDGETYSRTVTTLGDWDVTRKERDRLFVEEAPIIIGTIVEGD